MSCSTFKGGSPLCRESIVDLTSCQTEEKQYWKRPGQEPTPGASYIVWPLLQPGPTSIVLTKLNGSLGLSPHDLFLERLTDTSKAVPYYLLGCSQLSQTDI